MEFRNNEPIYLQVIQDIKLKMIQGMYRPGDKLPSTRDLALAYQINTNTAVRVYQEMERMGYCFTKRGLGTFITEDQETFQAIGQDQAGQVIREFMEKMTALGYGKAEMKSAIDEYDDQVVENEKNQKE